MRVALGLGCDRGASLLTLQTAVAQALSLAGLTHQAVAVCASIDRKNDEVALLQLGEQQHWPLQFYSAEQLAAVAVPNPSQVVQKYMGTPAVAEAAAMLAANTDMAGLLVEKHKYCGVDGKNATVSIARIKVMKKGKILLVGFGPGSKEDMTYRAREAIAGADVVIGYTTYIKLVEDLLDGKEVIRKGMTEEIDRCVEAYEQAKLGKVVAMVSSGDIGIYGMAGPTYEVLFQSGWRPGGDIEVEIVTGSTALSACASLVGAPLTHDFCSISLSDLLTPWPVIANRLVAAARADFVVALYNPKSGRRTKQIVEAQRILLQHRKPETPVAIVKSAYRKSQSIRMVRLDEMADCDIGMLSTVLIGNSSTFLRDNLMITPRGYANKYDSLTGETREGEKAGRSLGMGLIGWKSCVRSYLREFPDYSLKHVVEYFDMPFEEILSAIHGASADDVAGEFSAMHAADASQLLNEVNSWGRLRAVVRSRDAVSEMMLEGKDLALSGDRLKVENEHFHLHVEWRRVARAWLVMRAGKNYGAYFIDSNGEVVFKLALMNKDDASIQRYKQSWQKPGEPQEMNHE
jgi:precorrin-3B C17-methyltransferase